MVFWLFQGGFKVSSGTVEWYMSSYGADFDNSEIASPELLITGLKTMHIVGLACLRPVRETISRVVSSGIGN